MTVDAVMQEAVLQQGAAMGGMHLAAQAVERRHHLRYFQAHHGVIDRVAFAQRFHRDGHFLLVGVDHHVRERQLHVRHRHVVAGHGQVDVVGVVAQGRVEEGQVAGHARERAVNAACSGQQVIAGGRCPVAIGGHGHGVGLAQQGAAADRHEVTGTVRRQVHLEGRAVVEVEHAGDVQAADRRADVAARRQGAAAADEYIAKATVAGQPATTGDLHVATERTGHVELATVDHGGAGEGAAVATQGQRMTALAQEAAAADLAGVAQHAGGVGLESGTTADLDVAAVERIAGHAQGACFHAGLAHGAAAQGQGAGTGLGQCVAIVATDVARQRGTFGAVNVDRHVPLQVHRVVQIHAVEQAQRGAAGHPQPATAQRLAAAHHQSTVVNLQTARPCAVVDVGQVQRSNTGLRQAAGTADRAAHQYSLLGIQHGIRADLDFAVHTQRGAGAQRAAIELDPAHSIGTGGDGGEAARASHVQRGIRTQQHIPSAEVAFAQGDVPSYGSHCAIAYVEAAVAVHAQAQRATGPGRTRIGDQRGADARRGHAEGDVVELTCGPVAQLDRTHARVADGHCGATVGEGGAVASHHQAATRTVAGVQRQIAQ